MTSCVLQIVLCAVLCCYFGYTNAISVTDRLSSDVVNERFRSIRREVDGALLQLLPAVDTLHQVIEPLVPAIYASDTVTDLTGFWYWAEHQRRRSLAWNGLAPYGFVCSVQNNVFLFLPDSTGTLARFGVVDSTMPVGTSLTAWLPVEPESNADSAAANWQSIPTRVAKTDSFNSLLASGALQNLTRGNFTLDSRPWYSESISRGTNVSWVTPYVARDQQLWLAVSKGFLLPNSTATVGACLAQIPVRKLHAAVASVPETKVSHYMIVRSTGRLYASNVPQLVDIMNSAGGSRVWLQNSTRIAAVPFIAEMLPYLWSWNLITDTAGSTPDGYPDSSQVFSARVHLDGVNLLCRASVLATPGVGAAMVGCFYESDFDNGASSLLKYAIIATVVVLVCAVALTCGVVHLVWRGIAQVVHFMRLLDVSSFGAAAVSSAAGAGNQESARTDFRRIVSDWNEYIAQTGAQRRHGLWCCWSHIKRDPAVAHAPASLPLPVIAASSPLAQGQTIAVMSSSVQAGQSGAPTVALSSAQASGGSIGSPVHITFEGQQKRLSTGPKSVPMTMVGGVLDASLVGHDVEMDPVESERGRSADVGLQRVPGFSEPGSMKGQRVVSPGFGSWCCCFSGPRQSLPRKDHVPW